MRKQGLGVHRTTGNEPPFRAVLETFQEAPPRLSLSHAAYFSS